MKKKWWKRRKRRRGVVGVQQLETRQRTKTVTVNCLQNEFFVLESHIRRGGGVLQELVDVSAKVLKNMRVISRRSR